MSVCVPHCQYENCPTSYRAKQKGEWDSFSSIQLGFWKAVSYNAGLKMSSKPESIMSCVSSTDREQVRQHKDTVVPCDIIWRMLFQAKLNEHITYITRYTNSTLQTMANAYWCGKTYCVCIQTDFLCFVYESKIFFFLLCIR